MIAGIRMESLIEHDSNSDDIDGDNNPKRRKDEIAVMATMAAISSITTTAASRVSHLISNGKNNGAGKMANKAMKLQ